MSELMTLACIAKMFRCTPEKAKHLVRLPGFPAEAGGSTPRHRLWIRAEVHAFKPLVPEIKAVIKRAEAEAFIRKCLEIDTRSAANRRHHQAKRRTAQLQRTPPWADMNAIERIYREAVRLESETGIAHAVDHIIPLQGRLVSGLHVATNLQALPALVNLRKSNKFEGV